MTWYGRLLDIMLDRVPVEIQSNTNVPFKYTIIQELKDDITLTSVVTPLDEIINVSAGHGFVVGSIIVLWNSNGWFDQHIVKAVNTDAITLDFPISLPYEIADTIVVRGSSNLAVNGSVTPVKFTFKPRYMVPIDVGSIYSTMEHSTVADPSKFGNLTALTNGMYFQKVDGEVLSLGNYKKNDDFRRVGGTVEFPDKSGGGLFGTWISIPINVPYTYDAVERFYSSMNDSLDVYVRDDLSLLTSMEINLLGSLTKGEE